MIGIDIKAYGKLQKKHKALQLKHEALEESHGKLALKCAEKTSRIIALKEALEEIQKGEGAYDFNPANHAVNCINNMKSIATEALRQTPEKQ